MAEIVADTVGFGSSTLHVDLSALTWFDRIAIDGLALLDGVLDVRAAVTPYTKDFSGIYRFLTASGGVQGSFDAVTSNLDPSLYRLTTLYGEGFVDLQITAVPEPETYALMAVGLLALWGTVKRRRRP